MQRRKYLATLATSGTVAVAGCGVLGGGGGGPSGPEGTAKAFVQALNDGDTDKASDLLISESIEQYLTSSALNQWEATEITVENTETIDEFDNLADYRR